jgi:hypothetical protein
MNKRQRETVAFAEIVLGVEVTNAAPPAHSPLARLIAILDEEQPEGAGENLDS